MALPKVVSLEECADYQKTVEPFVPELLELPARLWASRWNPADLLDLYAQSNPLVSGFAFSIFLGFVFLILSELNRNYSQVDRVWSMLPTFYLAHLSYWARLNGLSHERLDLVTVVSFVWTLRLTFNYWRRGGYEIGSEDYRWAIVQRNIPRLAFFLLNVTFISFMQSVLLFAIAAPPAYNILLASQIEPGLKTADYGYCVLELGLILVEWIADGQQWNYQTAKHQYLKDAKVPAGYKQEDFDRGFIASGLWSVSRHPNFVAEQAIWFVLYHWSCFATRTRYGWASAGAVSLIVLFQGSTWLTELITSGKYTEYAYYQRQVSMFLPLSFKPYRPLKVGPTGGIKKTA